MSLGQRIRDLRRAAKLTQKDVAAMLEVDHTTISKWEADIYEPNAETLDKLASIFETTVDRLLGRKDLSTFHRQFTKMKDSPAQQEHSAAGTGRAFFGGSEQYTEEELEIARAAAKAAVEAYRKGMKKRDDR